MDSIEEEVTVIEALHPECSWMDSRGNPIAPMIPDAVVEHWELWPDPTYRGWWTGYVTVQGSDRYFVKGIRLAPASEFTVDLDCDKELLARLNPDIDFSGPVPVAKAPPTGTTYPAAGSDHPLYQKADNQPSEPARREKRPNPRKFTEPVRIDEPEASLPTDSDERKGIPMARGLLDYFPDALAEVARLSQAANEKHNPGEPMHWARGKSMDHPDCIIRHLADRGRMDTDGFLHDVKVAWRALAQLQETLEDLRGLPLPRGAWGDDVA